MEETIKGIYCIENIVNGKKYIGQSINIKKRWKTHKRNLKLNKHHNNYLQYAWNKYGEDAFKFYVVERLYTSPHIVYNILEAYYISEYSSNNPKYGYNLTVGGDGTLGHHLTDEQKKKISKMQTGRKLPDEWIKNISLAHKEKLKNGYMPKTEHLMKYNEDKKVRIDCYDINGDYISTYNGVHEAARSLNLEATNISKVLTKKHSNVKGYVFYYSDNEKPNKLDIFLRCSKCPIILFDNNYNQIGLYHNTGECQKAIGCDRSYISKSCKKHNMVLGKYYLRYYYDIHPKNYF